MWGFCIKMGKKESDLEISDEKKISHFLCNSVPFSLLSLFSSFEIFEKDQSPARKGLST